MRLNDKLNFLLVNENTRQEIKLTNGVNLISLMGTNTSIYNDSINNRDNIFAIYISHKTIELFNVKGYSVNTNNLVVLTITENQKFEINEMSCFIKISYNDDVVFDFVKMYENKELPNYIDFSNLFLKYAKLIKVTSMQAVDVMTTIDIPELHDFSEDC